MSTIDIRELRVNKLRKWIGIVIATTCASALLFMVVSPFLFPGVVQYYFNTVYAKAPYSNQSLEKIMPGTTTSEVRKLLGEPLSTETIDFLHCMIFTKGENGLDPTAAKFHGIGGNDKAPYLALWFSEQNKVNYVSNSHYTDLKDTELLGLLEERIVDLFGKPKETLFIPPTLVWSYTKLVNNGYVGDSGNIYTRRVYFNTFDRVVTVEMEKGSQFDIYSGIYEQSRTIN
ncbi:MAG: hypothetical protein DRQ48_08690 [Gammaproteobacteria bacterium]|nr:MAG: hypothetical protein DRQ48_08690 [Gammaproteobacteria bacterium]